MTRHKEALTLALKALEESHPEAYRHTITAIKEALAQPEQEPVGEAYLCEACNTPFDGAYECPSCGHNTAVKEPVYTTPPQRKPLTDEQAKLASEAVDQIMEQAQVFASAWSLVGGRFDLGNAMEDADQAKIELRTMVASLAREAAHGIKGDA